MVVYKITIANSVEERIVDLQDKKRLLAGAAIEGQAAAKLSLQDMLKLFRHDAEHDDRHNMDYRHAGLGARTRVLSELEPSLVETGTRKVPAVPEKRGDRRDEGIYGRRW